MKRCGHAYLTLDMASYRMVTRCLDCRKVWKDGGKLWRKTPAPKWPK